MVDNLADFQLTGSPFFIDAGLIDGKGKTLNEKKILVDPYNLHGHYFL